MNSLARSALLPLATLYGAVMRARRYLYEGNILATHKVRVPVVSVGNLTTGGTGKTPLVEWIAREVHKAGKDVCILSRGYGRRNAERRMVVSDGRNIESDPLLTGDEPLLLAESLRGIASVVCEGDRVGGANWIVENLKPDLILLDDAFQHRRLRRDLDIVTIDASNPWGGGALLPAGKLREPRRAVRRADIVVLTRVDLAGDIQHLMNSIRSLGFTGPIIKAQNRVFPPEPINLDSTEADHCNSEGYFAFCAIGNSSAFFAGLKTAGVNVTSHRAFRDHHVYSQLELDRVVREAEASGARRLVTTAKDAVKLKQLKIGMPLYVAKAELQLDNPAPLRAALGRLVAHS
jgi:tetraacyldisaccharide 4'-kinase